MRNKLIKEYQELENEVTEAPKIASDAMDAKISKFAKSCIDMKKQLEEFGVSEDKLTFFKQCYNHVMSKFIPCDNLLKEEEDVKINVDASTNDKDQAVDLAKKEKMNVKLVTENDQFDIENANDTLGAYLERNSEIIDKMIKDLQAIRDNNVDKADQETANDEVLPKLNTIITYLKYIGKGLDITGKKWGGSLNEYVEKHQNTLNVIINEINKLLNDDLLKENKNNSPWISIRYNFELLKEGSDLKKITTKKFIKEGKEFLNKSI